MHHLLRFDHFGQGAIRRLLFGLAAHRDGSKTAHTFDDVDGTLIGFRFPAAMTSVNVPGWHFHFLSADRSRGGHVLG